MAEKSNEEILHFETRAVHTGHKSDDWQNDPLVVPITLSTVYELPHASLPQSDELFYSRWKNPSRDAVEAAIATLEGGKYCCVFASGIAGIHTVFQMLRSGDHVVSLDNSYSGTYVLLRDIVSRSGISTTWVDFSDLKNVTNAMRPETRLVFVESPTNPCCEVIDIRQVADMVHSHNPKALVVVDNTFATPYYQNPLALGADVVVHSCTKFVNGHHDVLMGAVVTNSSELYDDLYFLQKSVGAVPSPFDCFLCLRGLRTLHLRMRAAGDNAQKIAEFLQSHPLVQKVSYPGLPSNSSHQLAKQQMINNGFGAVVSFFIKDADLNHSKKFIQSMKLIVSAVSLGGLLTTAQNPFSTSHGYVSEEVRIQMGITPNCIRLSVGVENVEDLKKDLDQALRASEHSA